MSWDKVVKRAIRDTLLAIVSLYVIMIISLCIFYPSTMMGITYDLGMDKLSMHFANTAYKRSGYAGHIAYATEVAIGIDDEAKIISYGERLIKNKDFLKYCAKKDDALGEDIDSSYEQYIYTQICVAKYDQGKKTAAVTRAVELTGNEFPPFNAVAAVLLAALKNSDVETVALIREKMQEIDYASLSETDKTYYDAIFGLTSDENGYAS
ncbi:MAG: hypothetical protein IKD47_02535 [Clostridia bacterium]|nr:hypothetical protein [Clostridia bacterium]